MRWGHWFHVHVDVQLDFKTLDLANWFDWLRLDVVYVLDFHAKFDQFETLCCLETEDALLFAVVSSDVHLSVDCSFGTFNG